MPTVNFAGYEGRSADGYWVASTGELAINERMINHSYDTTREVIFHEVGHSVWDKNVDKWGSWIDFWQNNKVEMPNDYAKLTPEEGFAECYAAYKMGPVNPGVNKWFSKNYEK